MAEAALLSFLAPSARPLAPQVTALPPLAAFHDLRWLFAFNQPWLGFTGVLVLLVVARSAVDAVLVMLAWPRDRDIPRPRFLPSLLSCAVLTVLVGLVMSPVVTLMFGVALLPFSWPYLAAVPILLGTAVALSQGGVGQAWWRRLPPTRTAAWVIATFAVLSLASVLMTHLDTPGIVAVAGLGRDRRRSGLVRPHRGSRPGGSGKAAPRVAVARRAVADPAGPAEQDQLGAGGAAGGGDGARPGRRAGPAGLHRDRPLRLGHRRRGGRGGHQGQRRRQPDRSGPWCQRPTEHGERAGGQGQRRGARRRRLRVGLLPQRGRPARRRTKPARPPVLLPRPERGRAADPVRTRR